MLGESWTVFTPFSVQVAPESMLSVWKWLNTPLSIPLTPPAPLLPAPPPDDPHDGWRACGRCSESYAA